MSINPAALAASTGLLTDTVTGGTSGPAGTSYNPNPNSTSSVYGLGKDDFMKLFLAQLQNQDPSKPVDDQQFLTQLSQFSLIDTLTQVQQTLQGTQLAQASSLIGKHVEGLDVNGAAVSGTVDSLVQSSDNGIVLVVGSQQIKPDAVTSVTEPASTGTTTTTQTQGTTA